MKSNMSTKDFIGPFCDLETRLVIFVDINFEKEKDNVYLIDVKDQDWTLWGHNDLWGHDHPY